MSSMAVAVGVSTPPTRVGMTTAVARSSALTTRSRWAGGVSTTTTPLPAALSRALASRRSVGASTTVRAWSWSSVASSTHSAALAWGSASTRVTGRPPSVATAARYTEVVVLPTPPLIAAETTITALPSAIPPSFGHVPPTTIRGGRVDDGRFLVLAAESRVRAPDPAARTSIRARDLAGPELGGDRRQLGRVDDAVEVGDAPVPDGEGGEEHDALVAQPH